MSIPEKNSNRPEPMAYGRGIPRGLGINILVHNVDRSARFQSEIFGARILYWEEHFAIMQVVDSTWLLHSDWSYRSHELIGAVSGVQARGCGVELRLYGVNPDQAEAAARRPRCSRPRWSGRQGTRAARGLYRRRRWIRLGAVGLGSVPCATRSASTRSHTLTDLNMRGVRAPGRSLCHTSDTHLCPLWRF